MRKIVSNATPIISLAVIDRLPFLEDIFKKIYIAEAVYDEITYARYPGYKELDSQLFEVKSINDREGLDSLLNDLDLGEAESIQLASEIKADALIMDERSGYKIAQKKGLPVIGTLTVLLMAKIIKTILVKRELSTGIALTDLPAANVLVRTILTVFFFFSLLKRHRQVKQSLENAR